MFEIPPVEAPPDDIPDDYTREGQRRLYEQAHEHRDEFRAFAKGVCETWIGFIVVVTLSQMILPRFGFGLSDGAFIAIVTSTTVSVLGFGFVWGSGIFPNSKRNPPQ